MSYVLILSFIWYSICETTQDCMKQSTGCAFCRTLFEQLYFRCCRLTSQLVFSRIFLSFYRWSEHSCKWCIWVFKYFWRRDELDCCGDGHKDVFSFHLLSISLFLWLVKETSLLQRRNSELKYKWSVRAGALCALRLFEGKLYPNRSHTGCKKTKTPMFWCMHLYIYCREIVSMKVV